MEDAGDVPRAVDERQRRERDEVRAGAFGEGVDGEPSQGEAVHFGDLLSLFRERVSIVCGRPSRCAG